MGGGGRAAMLGSYRPCLYSALDRSNHDSQCVTERSGHWSFNTSGGAQDKKKIQNAREGEGGREIERQAC